MKISISQRRPDSHYRAESKPDVYTLTVEHEEARMAVNIDESETYRLIDAHKLTPYDEVTFDTHSEVRWDNTPPLPDTKAETQES